MDPRISFSNDFVIGHQASKQENIYREAPVSSDFEFSVKNYSMIPADEVFSQGRLLPLNSECSKKVTLRDELLVNDERSSLKFPKISSKWKERLGLRRGASKKDIKNKSDGFLHRVSHQKGETTVNKDNMELIYE